MIPERSNLPAKEKLMKKFILASLCLFLSTAVSFSAEPITGVWKTIDDETGESKSLVRIYEHQGLYYGRVVKLFKNPDTTAKGIKGNPKINGLDIIWNMKDTGEKFTGGKILDPKKGKIYTCEIWKNKEGSLTVRGKIGFFGRNQTWQAEPPSTNTVAEASSGAIAAPLPAKPVAEALIPSIPEKE